MVVAVEVGLELAGQVGNQVLVQGVGLTEVSSELLQVVVLADSYFAGS